MAKIWINRIIARTKKYSDCPLRYKDDVLNLLKEDAANETVTPFGKMTAEMFYELTGEVYI